jgi:hypothetical protein
VIKEKSRAVEEIIRLQDENHSPVLIAKNAAIAISISSSMSNSLREF